MNLGRRPTAESGTENSAIFDSPAQVNSESLARSLNIVWRGSHPILATNMATVGLNQ